MTYTLFCHPDGNLLPDTGYPAGHILIAIRISRAGRYRAYEHTLIILIMRIPIPNPEIRGTRTGYVIRFTCPACAAESVIVNTIARNHFKNSRAATCRKCGKRLTVLTPGRD